MTRALERLRKHYQKNAHLEAQVSLTDRAISPTPTGSIMSFEVEQGPTVVITTEGEKISKGQLKKLVPVYQENSVDDDLLNEGRRNMRDYLQTKGYFDATVDVDRRPMPEQDQLDIVYKIDPGVRHKLVSIKIEGNKYFDTAAIRERMAIQPSSCAPAQWAIQPAAAHRRCQLDQVSLSGEWLSASQSRCRTGGELSGQEERNGGGLQDYRRSADAGERGEARRG